MSASCSKKVRASYAIRRLRASKRPAPRRRNSKTEIQISFRRPLRRMPTKVTCFSAREKEPRRRHRPELTSSTTRQTFRAPTRLQPPRTQLSPIGQPEVRSCAIHLAQATSTSKMAIGARARSNLGSPNQSQGRTTRFKTPQLASDSTRRLTIRTTRRCDQMKVSSFNSR